MITLLSDFGYRDAYVAIMKGVITKIAGDVSICDLSHALPPQDILAARFNLMMAYAHFPADTVHLAVVDPGVGSARRAIALHCPSGFFIGPDNGLFSGVLQQEAVLAAVTLNNSDYWRSPQPSHTFHGRDIFAPAAAHLAKGVPIEALGDRLDPNTLTQVELPFTCSANQCTGCLQYIDRFGNLISNIPASVVPDHPWQVALKTSTRSSTFTSVATYSDMPAGGLAALIGSHGWVEIACREGSAARSLNGAVRDQVVLSSTQFQ